MTRTVVVDPAVRLDRLAKAIYGSELGGTVEGLLNVNPGLAALGPIVPAGTVLNVPEEVAAEAPVVVRPWD